MLIYNKLKLIRKMLSLSQSDIEGKTGLSQRDISQLENGKKKFIPTAYIQFLNSKGIPLNLLFDDSFPLDDFENSIRENVLTNVPIGVPKDPFFLPESGKTKSTNIVSLPIPVEPDEELVSVPLVDISVAAGTGFNNPTYMEEIDCIRFPQSMIKGNYTYLCVRIKGESMVPTLQDGGYLVVRLLDRSEWENIRDGHVYVVSDCEGKAYVKRIKNRLKEYGIIICNSDNPDPMGYPSFNLQENELHSVWHAEWYISAKMPNIHATYYNKVSELELAFDNMRREFKEELLQMRKEIRAVLPQ